MNKATIIIYKEWLELRQERGLLVSTLLPPLLLGLMPIIIVAVLGQTPDKDTAKMG